MLKREGEEKSRSITAMYFMNRRDKITYMLVFHSRQGTRCKALPGLRHSIIHFRVKSHEDEILLRLKFRFAATMRRFGSNVDIPGFSAKYILLEKLP